jgi:hypothetical protein
VGTHALYAQVPQSDIVGLAATLAGKSPTGHTHPVAPVTVAYAASITLDPTALPNPSAAVNITATGNITALDLSTTGAADRQRVEVAVLASGGTRAVTVVSAVGVTTGVGRGPYSPVSGQLWVGLFEYFALASKWMITAATVTSA